MVPYSEVLSLIWLVIEDKYLPEYVWRSDKKMSVLSEIICGEKNELVKY